MGRYLLALEGNGDIDHYLLIIFTLIEELGRLVPGTAMLR